MKNTRSLLAPIIGACLLALACEPASVTEARNQLQRGGVRPNIRLTIPISQDTFTIGQFLPETDTTTVNGLMGIRLDPDSVNVDVGSKLQFSNLTFSQFNYSFDQMLQTQQTGTSLTLPVPPVRTGVAPVGVSRVLFPAGPPPQIRFNTPAGSSVTGATIGTGQVVRSITNSTGCDFTTTISLTDSLNNAIVSFTPNTPVPTGQTVTDSVAADSATVSGFAQVNATAALTGACVPSGTLATDITFRPMTLAAVTLKNVSEGFTQTYSPLAAEARINAVDTVFVGTGSFSLTLQNRLPITDTVTVRLNGVTKAGSVVTGTLAVPAASGTGTTTSGTLVLDLAGARILPGQVVAQVTGTAKAAQATITPTNATNAAVVSGGGSLTIQSLSGLLDPAQTPELVVSVENYQEVASTSVDFGDLEDAINSATLNSATAVLTVSNSSQIPMVLSNFKLGLVQINSAGQLLRDGSGNLAFEKDALGTPILTTVANPGATTFTAQRSGTSSVSLNAAALIDRLAHLIISKQRVAMVTTGTAAAGDGARSRITQTDVVKVRFQLLVGLDITVPATGVLFTRNQVTDGLDMDSSDANELTTRIVQATAGAKVTNATPFGVVVQLVLVKDSVAPSVDLFTVPGRVTLDSVVLRAPAVDANGLVTAPVSDSVSVSISGTNARLLFNKKFTVGARIRLLPGTGGGGRGALRGTDRIIVSSKAQVDVKAGGGT
ncbi:MAG: hypothetical protein HY700_13715 [Gemmatimonadetes bacterium]|nr:hypothetical protein [Gemmatimonadota bacterium]